ncbi:MAG: hypothetical protein DMG39_11970 [Acidobacteria bacterium]|nr:MAG: hypothetical protein DMG39_11970 [Acidobacteriota bacterium]
MIARDYNRSSIISWSITSESAKSPERNAFLHELAAAARPLDATRLITATTNRSSLAEPHKTGD